MANTHSFREVEDATWLRAQVRPRASTQRPFRVVDLFCGCGGMTLGLEEAARRARRSVEIRLAVDSSPVACAVFKANYPSAPVVAAGVESIFDRDPGRPRSRPEIEVSRFVGAPDALIGGPPCEGHSDLNNHTRRNDKKNDLYLRMARAAEVLRPAVVVIENVPQVLRDAKDVARVTQAALEQLGYRVDGRVIDMTRVGVPQKRRRYIMLASLVDAVDPEAILEDLAARECRERTVGWAIRDLESVSAIEEIDRPSQASTENRKRIRFLFENSMYNLPNAERPECHLNGHSYISMYGRLRWGAPAQTITTGFTSMGQGRYVHPSRRRTLTPHEASRLQTFPDWFDWSKASGRTALAGMIGNAVPPLMMTVLGTAIIRCLDEKSSSTRKASP